MMTFITFPTIMTSTAYPMENMPGWLSIPVHLNPLTYSVEAFRWMLLEAPDVPIALSLTVITAFALIMMGIGSWAFDRTGDQ
jgi:ABC-2 type transport system permease protein